MHSVLIVGCGSIGERHLRCFRNTGRANVMACDSNQALLATIESTYNVPVVADWKRALGGAFDSVVICTPAPWHVPMATQALAAGHHVLLEKPLSHSLDGLPTLVAARDRAQKQLAVAYVYHVFPFLCEARDFLRRGEFGPVLQATATSGQPFHRLRPGYAHSYYRDRAAGGGAIQDALTHLVNWFESVLGPTDSVLGDCAHLALDGVEVEDTVNLLARNRGALVSYSLNQFQAPNETTLAFHAADGSVRIEFQRQRWGTLAQGAPDWLWHEAPVVGRDAMFISQANAFLDQIEGQPARLCSLEAAAQTLRVNLAAIASADRGRRVACGDLETHE